jgi:4-alpha-glucanotransferase
MMNNPLYETRPRYAGVLFHITSLPGPYGIGDLGKAAYDFADFLQAAGVTLWQILPLGPTGFGNSPYAARSSFAGNELLLSPDKLAEDGLLEKADLDGLKAAFAGIDPGRVDYGLVEEKKLPVLKKAARNFIKLCETLRNSAVEYKDFCAKNSLWLDDYALFQVLCEHYKDARWHTVWDPAIGRRDAAFMENIKSQKWDKCPEFRDKCPEFGNSIEVWKVLQFFFEKQWLALRSYVNNKIVKGTGGQERTIKIVGDIPIFVAPDSVDSWANIELFKTGPDGKYSVVSGVPPDFFSATGQLWGNPIYDWDKMKARGYKWWTARIRRLLEQVDIFRIDHFRGFDEYWVVPAGNPTAEHGTWEKGPGADFFETVKKALADKCDESGSLPVLAEDLGLMTEGVKRLRDGEGFPGMKVCQFGFEDMKAGVLDARHGFLPHNYSYNFAAYTGTHDNDTTAGWYDKLDEAGKKTVAEYFDSGGKTAALPAAQIAWAMVRAVASSHAKYAVFPLQDLLGLGSEARMNLPATCGSHNWSWRLAGRGGGLGLSESLAWRLKLLTELYGR